MSVIAIHDTGEGRFNWRRVFGFFISIVLLAVIAGLVMLKEWSAAFALLVLPGAMLGYWLQGQYPNRFPSWATRLLSLVATVFPFVAWLVQQRDIEDHNAKLLKQFNAMLASYKLPLLPEKKLDEMAGSGSLLGLGKLARAMAKRPGLPSSRTLELLYRERYGMPRLDLWLAHRDDLAEEVCKIVAKGDRLPAPGPGFPYQAKSLTRIVRHQRSFSVDVLAGTLRLLGDLWWRLDRYSKFLDSNGGAGSVLPSLDVLNRIEAERGLPVNAETLYRLRDPGLALQLMEAIEDSESPKELRLLRRGIFLAEVDLDAARLKERVCRQAALEPEVAEMLHAYLVRKESVSKVVSLQNLETEATAWKVASTKSLGTVYSTEVNAVHSDLQGGYWPTAHRNIGRSTTRPATTDEAGFAVIEDAVDEVPDRTVELLLPVLRGIALGPGGFHQSIDELTQFDAYMITFDSTRGPLKEMVDCLADHSHERRLEEIGVRFRQPNGKQVYNFGKYTTATRIGLAPAGSTFELFHARFLGDFQKVFENRRTVFPNTKTLHIRDDDFANVELTLNRIDLLHSRYLHYGPHFGDVFGEASIEDVYDAISEKADLSVGQRSALRRVVEIVEG